MNVGKARAATHERNDLGRDFVAGDIHGSYETLERALEAVRFKPERDRLFSAGDLVNRGPHSLDALKWLEERRIHDAVLGNHETMVLKTLLNPARRVLFGWMAGIDDAPREQWIEALWRFPSESAPTGRTVSARHTSSRWTITPVLPLATSSSGPCRTPSRQTAALAVLIEPTLLRRR